MSRMFLLGMSVEARMRGGASLNKHGESSVGAGRSTVSAQRTFVGPVHLLYEVGQARHKEFELRDDPLGDRFGREEPGETHQGIDTDSLDQRVRTRSGPLLGKDEGDSAPKINGCGSNLGSVGSVLPPRATNESFD